jgi:hypothetical protein
MMMSPGVMWTISVVQHLEELLCCNGKSIESEVPEALIHLRSEKGIWIIYLVFFACFQSVVL